MKKIELLAPAGNMKSFKAAIHAGADAVYIGGKVFGARNYADNFEIEEIREAVIYAHLYDRKVYVTVNTIIYETEVSSFLSYMEELISVHIDAIILQDLGMADLLHQLYPTLELHASTQMHIHNIEGVKMAAQLGFKRAVIAREVDINQIRDIQKKSPIELEVFGHGALCVCYSGQCYMSYLIGGRSGNKGTCAQCCRQKYTVQYQGKTYNQGSYPLSMRDLNVLSYVKDFISAGIDSIKIEGRMKRAEYVFLVTSLYRKAIDAYYQKKENIITKNDEKRLYKIFNRTFTKGFLFGEDEKNIVNDNRPNHMGIPLGKIIQNHKNRICVKLKEDLMVGDGIRILGDQEDYGMNVLEIYKQNCFTVRAYAGDLVEIPCDVSVSKGNILIKTTDKRDLEEMDLQLQKCPKIPIEIEVFAFVNTPLKMIVRDGIREITVKGNIIEEAKSAPITEENIKKQVTKLGNTPFSVGNIHISLSPTIFIPIQELNALRRKAIDMLIFKKLQRKAISKKQYCRVVPKFLEAKQRVISISTIKQYEKIKNKKWDTIYVPSDIYKIIKDTRLIERMSRVVKKYTYPNQNVLISEIGGLYQSNHVDTFFSLNVTNSYTVALLHSLGCKKVALSYECNLYQIRKIIENYTKRYHQKPFVGAMIYGREEVMITKYDLLGKYQLEKGCLVDRFQNKYPLIRKDGYTTIYNYQKRKESEDLYFDAGLSYVFYQIDGD